MRLPPPLACCLPPPCTCDPPCSCAAGLSPWLPLTSDPSDSWALTLVCEPEPGPGLTCKDDSGGWAGRVAGDAPQRDGPAAKVARAST